VVGGGERRAYITSHGSVLGAQQHQEATPGAHLRLSMINFRRVLSS